MSESSQLSPIEYKRKDGRYRDPVGLRGLVEGRYIVGLTLFLTLGGFLAGYQGIFASVVAMESFGAAFPDLYTNPLLTAWCASTLMLVAMLGAWMNGLVCDQIGRKANIKLYVVVFLLGSSLQTGAMSSTHLFAGRAISGLALGALTQVIPMYIAEISTPNIRGSLVSLQQLAMTVGFVAGYWIAYATSYIGGIRCAPGVPYTGPLSNGSPTFNPYTDIPSGGCTGQTQASWRIPLGLQLFPALCLGVGMFFMPHSPRWLVQQGREDEALQTLTRLRRKPAGDRSVGVEFLEITADVRYAREITDAAFPNAGMFRLWKHRKGVFFTTRKMAKRLFVGGLPLTFQQNMAINVFAPLVFGRLGLSKNAISLLVGLYGIVNILATLPGVILVDRVGRRPLLYSGAVGCFVSMIVIGTLATMYSSDWQAHGVAVRAVIVFMFLYNINFSYSWGPIGIVIPSEIYPQHLRSTGLAFAIPGMWSANFMAALSLPKYIEGGGGIAYYITAAVCMFGILATCFLFPETKGCTLEDMDTAFGSKITDSEREHKECICRDLGLPVRKEV